MINGTFVLGILIAAAVVTGMLFLVFGQITVRKLRKNPETRESLGFEFVSGWDVINTAQALALPRAWSKRLESSPVSFMHAKASILLEKTNKFDRVLALLFYGFLLVTGFAVPLLVLLDAAGWVQWKN